MFLCSWSNLCLQIPARTDTQLHILWRRAWLTALCALGPEFTLQLALGQWSSARQSVRDFNAAGLKNWTLKHAFYADSGGFFLYTPDFPPIPIDAKQLLYLIQHGYIECPEISEMEIYEKNKVDLLLRIISTGQIVWFSVTIMARGAQGLFVSGFELTTAAFILCSFGTTFCWWQKGADVAIPEKLTTTHSMSEILVEGGDAVTGLYHRTPLDFISRDEWHWSLYWTHWINILRKMHINFAPRNLPHDRFENTMWLDIKARGALPAFIITSLLYSGIFLAGWNDHFPTPTEQILWRVASLSMMISVALYFITAFAYVLYPALGQYFKSPTPSISESQSMDTLRNLSSTGSDCERYPVKQAYAASDSSSRSEDTSSAKHKRKRSRLSEIAARLRNNSVSKDPLLDIPLKATLPMYGVGFLYCASRTLIIILDIIQLRSMPASAYTTIGWSSFVPHIS